ncbi:hypothetical protein [Delftia sp.]|uniref:hypothetical protein n=1 Tax=Delftia sp. TaxID=1886637 RepID=UPI00338FBEBA
MNDAFGDALMVEMGDLFAENEVLKQNGPALAYFNEFWLSAIATPWLVVST